MLIQVSVTSIHSQTLYTQIGTDPTWEDLLATNPFPIGVNSTQGALGSTIDVNNALVEPESSRPIEQEIQIHTLCNSSISRDDFPKWTRWYQEDGNTQVFRLFKDEYNVRNDRRPAPRIEAETSDYTDGTVGRWHEWSGRYTIVKAQDMNIFQIWGKSEEKPDGSGLMMIGLRKNGDVYWNKRDGHTYITIFPNAVGKSFDITVRDNGRDYELYLNGELKHIHSIVRTGPCHFRWGLYGHDYVPAEAMLFVTGATVDPVPGIRDNIDTLALSTSSIGLGTIEQTPYSLKFPLNANVTLNALPASGWKFKKWSGDDSSSVNPLNLVMTGEKNIVAVFESAEEKAPYSGSPVQIPGVIEAENYDFGGENVSYHDYDAGNKFALYRQDNVDIDQTTTGEYIISNIYPNEWLNYSVEVNQEGFYNFRFLYASRRAGGKLGAEIVGASEPLFTNLSVPLTRSLNDFQTLIQDSVWLPKGSLILRLNFEREGYNLDKITIDKTTASLLHKPVEKNLLLYPNPTSGYVQLRNVQEWKLYSLSGTLLREGSSNKIDLTNYKKGIYIIHIKNSFYKIGKH